MKTATTLISLKVVFSCLLSHANQHLNTFSSTLSL
nr:MAG TPA: hypothetical protein [Caudoviricetes sp.]